MRIAPTFNVAYRALSRNKMRTGLTALGIIIGVGAVITMVGIGNGAKAQVEAQVASLGQNVIQVSAGSTSSRGSVRLGLGSSSALTVDDAEAIESEIPDVARVSPEVRTITWVVVLTSGLTRATSGISLSIASASSTVR